MGRGDYKNRFTEWFTQVRGGDRRVPNSWVGVPLPVSFFFFQPIFHLWAHQLPGLGSEVSPFVPQYLFSLLYSLICSFLLVSFFGVGACLPLSDRTFGRRRDFRIGPAYDPCRSKEVTKWFREAGLGSRSLFFIFCLLLLLLLFFSPPYERINWPGWDRRFRPLFLDPFLLPCLSFSLF